MAPDPTVEAERLNYLLALRNYAFTSASLRAFTPQLTVDSAYRDQAGGDVAQSLRRQAWYPAPRMTYGTPSTPGTREAAHGMTLERTVRVGEIAGNTRAFPNYAVAYYDARGAHTYRNVWSTATPGSDVPNLGQMQIAEGGFVYKVLFSTAQPNDFPQDILQGSVEATIVPNFDGVPIKVRLLQIDIAVKDNRAGTTGWYFATYAYDSTISVSSPWRRMVPVGLMWGNDPQGAPLAQSWINTSAPAYARNHLGVDGRLNGPVDNPDSACMSCHSTAQSPAVASTVPTGACRQPPFLSMWFRNLPGSAPFGRASLSGQTCDTTPPANAPTAADYSLQLGATVSRALSTATFNPCTWDTATPPVAPATPAPAGPPTPTPPSAAPTPGAPNVAPVFEVTRE
jgi:hypothetical protein